MRWQGFFLLNFKLEALHLLSYLPSRLCGIFLFNQEKHFECFYLLQTNVLKEKRNVISHFHINF